MFLTPADALISPARYTERCMSQLSRHFRRQSRRRLRRFAPISAAAAMMPPAASSTPLRPPQPSPPPPLFSADAAADDFLPSFYAGPFRFQPASLKRRRRTFEYLLLKATFLKEGHFMIADSQATQAMPITIE